MKEITLSLAHYKAIRHQHGAEAAVEALRAEIESHVSHEIELSVRGPNGDAERVASLSFVKAATYNRADQWFSNVHLLTCGFADFNEAEHLAVANLFTVLTNPHNLDVYADEGDVAGLIVGSTAAPRAFFKFER